MEGVGLVQSTRNEARTPTLGHGHGRPGDGPGSAPSGHAGAFGGVLRSFFTIGAIASFFVCWVSVIQNRKDPLV